VKMPAIEEDASSFNMAPMIDMVFQLLIFFMVESHFSTMQNIDLQIPTAAHAVVPKERAERVVVNIRADGNIFCGDQPAADVLELKKMVKAYRDLIPDARIYLRADRETPHGAVRKVMGAMSELGIDDFIIGAFKPSEGQQVNP